MGIQVDSSNYAINTALPAGSIVDEINALTSNTVTIAGWCKRISGDDNIAAIFLDDAFTNRFVQVGIDRQSLDFLARAYAKQGGNDSIVNLDQADSITDDDWHLVVGIFGPSSITVYLDGSAISATGAPGTYPSTIDSLRFGWDQQGASGTAGEVAHVAVWDSGLSAVNIDALPTTRPDEITPPPKHYFKLESNLDDTGTAEGTADEIVMTEVGTVTYTTDPYPTPSADLTVSSISGSAGSIAAPVITQTRTVTVGDITGLSGSIDEPTITRTVQQVNLTVSPIAGTAGSIVAPNIVPTLPADLVAGPITGTSGTIGAAVITVTSPANLTVSPITGSAGSIGAPTITVVQPSELTVSPVNGSAGSIGTPVITIAMGEVVGEAATFDAPDDERTVYWSPGDDHVNELGWEAPVGPGEVQARYVDLSDVMQAGDALVGATAQFIASTVASTGEDATATPQLQSLQFDPEGRLRLYVTGTLDDRAYEVRLRATGSALTHERYVRLLGNDRGRP
ncbi:MAG: LamG-like jellyroll fold domain-containing protein [Pseudomonadota bacterium]